MCKPAFAYLLKCADGSLYAGWTNDPDARLAAHNSGLGAKYTRARRRPSHWPTLSAVTTSVPPCVAKPS